MGKKGNTKKGKAVSLDVFLGHTAKDPLPSHIPPNNYADELQQAMSGRELESLISKLSIQESLTSEKFCLCHFNHVETYPNVFLPCEVGIVKYSLDSGITEYYHSFIHPGKLPMGSAYEAKDHSEKTHLIPPEGFEQSENNYSMIFRSIESILGNSDGEMSPLYVLDQDIQKSLFIVDWLAENCQQQGASHVNAIKIRSLNKLVCELRRHIDLNDLRFKFNSPSQVTSYLLSSSFMCYENTACAWHDENDRVNYCSLALARNYAYVISDLCCEYYDIRMLPNRHCPAALLDDKRYEVVTKESDVVQKKCSPASWTRKGIATQ